ncbi:MULTISPECIES: alpha/beta fold hydrolase [Thermocrispum]|jgi:ABC-2 type transport system ATP-binding protein|uniref:ABC transporter ATP-binding protein n=1 Tax=Thermocrispum agreste TaxID=37925 RepID=A0A2W4JPY6_9PSEU|nr:MULTISPECIES: alpha/beta fold hydrolase [Thermocrispum]PZN01031.1 MAG: ABC transporter ATP-binding protein [Thermocrispum agreste]
MRVVRLPRKRLPRLLLVVTLVAGVVAAVGGIAYAVRPQPPDVTVAERFVHVPSSPGSPRQERLDTTLYIPETARATPAPAVLLPHGFGGSKHSVTRDAQELAERGFVVLAYSARGHGRSSGKIGLNDPDAEVADAGKLLDYLAAQSTVAKDADGDPRVAVVGASYAGSLALLLAGTDDRVDAIVPVMTYNDLEQALIPNTGTTGRFTPRSPAESIGEPGGVFKQAWTGNLFLGGMGTPDRGTGGPPPDAPEAGADPDDAPGGQAEGAAGALSSGSLGGGLASPRGAFGGPGGGDGEAIGPCGRFTPEVCQAYADMAEDGKPSRQTRALLARVSPKSVTMNITVPALLVQGERDTLFGLDQADANAKQIAAAGGEVQVVWYAGGHDGGGPGPQLRAKIGDWLAYQLGGPDAPAENPLPAFRYDIQGTYQASRAPSVRTIETSSYPGLGTAVTTRHDVPLHGGPQTISNPPGGNPASISGVPGINAIAGRSSIAASLFGVDLPGQAAAFTSAPMRSQLTAAGSPTVRLRVTALPGSGGARGGTNDVVLFVKFYTVDPDNRRTLAGNAVAPVRIPDVRTGEPVEVTVSLPGIVKPVDPDHRVQVVVATTDQAYHNATEPISYRVSVAGPISIPSVSGTATGGQWPAAQLLGIGAVLALGLGVALVAAVRRRRARSVDDELSDVPLVIEGLTKKYPGGLTAVDDLSFSVQRGQVLGLLGPNGAGKTTTLRMLMGLITPTSGQIRVFGHRVYPGAPVLSRIGSFVEGSGFLPHLSGRQNLELYWASTGRPREQAHFDEALEIAGLGSAVDRKVRTYSQGMRQRLAIAQAMLGLPELLVLDEPMNGLDPPQIHQMREVLKRYAATGRTVLVSSHLLAEVEQTSTHVVVMHRGRLIAEGEVGEIVAAGGEATFVVDKPEEAARALTAVKGVTSVETNGRAVHANLDGMARSEAVAALVNAGVAVEQAGPRRRLEDAFLRLVGEEPHE